LIIVESIDFHSCKKSLELGGWKDGWMDGWMDGHNGGFKDCLQQLKMRTFFLH
jgi:hypothetical protein